MSRESYIFTSESVSEGHPDKVCDRISDAVLDAFIALEPEARVACETFATTNRVVWLVERLVCLIKICCQDKWIRSMKL